jgi:flavin reductase (DIM6/NTAB) family NADH-FMN oxidoreductase RutF
MLLAVEHDCYTYEVLQNNDDFVMAMPTADMIDAVTVCGQTTGTEVNKFDELDLETMPGTEVDAPLLVDAGGNIECRTVHTHTYEDHTYYFAEPLAVHVREGWFEHKVLTAEADPLLYLGSRREDGETVRFYTGLESEYRRSDDGDHLEGLPTAY